MAKNRDELIAEYNDENGPTHDLGTPQQEQRLGASTKAALDQAMGLTAGTTGAVGAVGSLGTPNERLIASMDEQRSRGGLGASQDYMKVGVPLMGLAATAGAGIAESQRMVSGTPTHIGPNATQNTYMDLNGDTWRKVGNKWKLEPTGPKGAIYSEIMSNKDMHVYMAQEIEHARRAEARGERVLQRPWDKASPAWPSADAARNDALKAQQRRLGGFGSAAQTEAARAAKQAKGQAKSAIDPKKLESAVRRYFNQAAIARELSRVARVPAMAGQVSRAIPAGQAVALIAEPLMAFMSVFDDPTEGTFGISFGTQLKSMAATLTKSTGKPTPLQPRHLEPEAIQRLRDEPETSQDLYEFGALSEELWQEVKPRSGEPLVQWGEPGELPPSAVSWQEEYARQQEGE